MYRDGRNRSNRAIIPANLTETLLPTETDMSQPMDLQGYWLLAVSAHAQERSSQYSRGKLVFFHPANRGIVHAGTAL